jgi:hypothetical protein
MAAQLVDQGLHDVLDDREAPDGVSVQRRVARRELGLVAGREGDGARGVGDAHEEHAADARLQVLVGEPLGLAAEHRVEHVGERDVRGLDGGDGEADAEPPGELPRVVERVRRAVP